MKMKANKTPDATIPKRKSKPNKRKAKTKTK